jgi:hypothetical protein
MLSEEIVRLPKEYWYYGPSWRGIKWGKGNGFWIEPMKFISTELKYFLRLSASIITVYNFSTHNISFELRVNDDYGSDVVF